MKEEYTRETYPSFGKKYNSECAIISLTSWTARINTVAKTIYSLLKQCPGFHIVLVLSEEEFPKMMDELPENLKLFVNNELIEILWVYKNYKSFKKWIFTSDKYRDVPIISADDGCMYTENFAKQLYSSWLKNKNSISAITVIKYNNFYIPVGCRGILYPPNSAKHYLNLLIPNVLKTNHDDGLTAALNKNKIIDIKSVYHINTKHKNFNIFTDDECFALSVNNAFNNKDIFKLYDIVKALS